MDETKKIGTEKIPKLLLKYSIPAILGMLINAIYNILDTVFIGQSSDLGRIGIAGVAITFGIYVIIMGTAMLFGNGGAILFSTYLGQKKEKEAKQVLGNSTALLLISSITLTIIGLVFINPILRFLGAEGELFKYAKEYITVIIWGAAFQCISLGLNSFVRADGHPKTAMSTMILGSVIDVILDIVFIFVFKWGMFGAALSTIIGQMVSAIWVVCHFLSKRCTYKLELKNMKLDFKYVKLIIGYGTTSFIIQVAGSVVNIVLNKLLVKHGGDVAVSGMGIISSIATIVILPVLGLVQGAQPIISYNYGAGNKERIKETLKLNMIISTIMMIICYIITYMFTNSIIGIFNHEEELLTFTSRAIKIWFLALPVIGMQITCSNYFQCVRKS